MSIPLPSSTVPPLSRTEAPATTAPLTAIPTSPLLPQPSLPPAAGASPSSGGVMTNEQLTAAVLDLGRMVAGIHAFLLGPHSSTPTTTQQLLPPTTTQQLLPPPTTTQQLLPPPTTQQLLPPPANAPSEGVPIQDIRFPPSPSPLPAWLTGASPPVYTNTPAHPTVPLLPNITAGFGHGGVPASGTLYGGIDGTLVPGPSLGAVPTLGAAPPGAAPTAFATFPMAPAPAGFGAAAPAVLGAAEFQPKGYKLDFTTYDGSVDPLNWLTHCEQFFWGQRTPESQRTWMASYHLTGAAQTWYYALLLDEGMPSWERFKELCRLQFRPPIYGSRLTELGHLPFHSTVQEFADHF